MKYESLENYEPTSFLWGILSKCRLDLKNLIVELEKLNRSDLIRFQLEYRIAVLNIMPDEEIEVHVAGNIYRPTYDHRIEFSEWVVSLGENFYKSAMNKTLELTSFFKSVYETNAFSNTTDQTWNTVLNDASVYGSSTSPQYIAYKVFETKFGEDLWEIIDNLLE